MKLINNRKIELKIEKLMKKLKICLKFNKF